MGRYIMTEIELCKIIDITAMFALAIWSAWYFGTRRYEGVE
jgi:hypothetical protein